MALGKITFRKTGKKARVWINRVTKGTRMKGRYCVKVERNKPAKKAFRGAQPVGYFIMGCFSSAEKAKARANALANGTYRKGKKRR